MLALQSLILIDNNMRTKQEVWEESFDDAMRNSGFNPDEVYQIFAKISGCEDIVNPILRTTLKSRLDLNIHADYVGSLPMVMAHGAEKRAEAIFSDLSSKTGVNLEDHKLSVQNNTYLAHISLPNFHLLYFSLTDGRVKK